MYLLFSLSSQKTFTSNSSLVTRFFVIVHELKKNNLNTKNYKASWYCCMSSFFLNSRTTAKDIMNSSK